MFQLIYKKIFAIFIVSDRQKWSFHSSSNLFVFRHPRNDVMEQRHNLFCGSHYKNFKRAIQNFFLFYFIIQKVREITMAPTISKVITIIFLKWKLLFLSQFYLFKCNDFPKFHYYNSKFSNIKGSLLSFHEISQFYSRQG